jgi:hypothetical protein
VLDVAVEVENLGPEEPAKVFGENHFTLSDTAAYIIHIRHFSFKLNTVSVLFHTMQAGLHVWQAGS